MPELLHTLDSMYKKEEQEKKFLASLQGVDLGGEETEEKPTFDEIQMRALGLDTGIKDDVVGLQGNLAAQKGFGIGAGLGYSNE